MERTEPLLFKKYPNLKKKVPWIPLLTGIPTPIDRLTTVEKEFNLSSEGRLFIKRDDKNHDVYGGNKLRKFEFIFGKAMKKKKKGMITMGGIGTNHGLACAIITKNLGLKCKLFLGDQPLTWHVQRSLLLYDYFGAKLSFSKSFEIILLKALLFRLFHPKYYVMSFGGSPLFGIGSSLGSVGFINAMFELKDQIDDGQIPEPDVIFVAAGSTGTAAGLTAGCKILGLKTKVYLVSVSLDLVVNPKALIKIANKAIKYLRKRDKSIPNVKVVETDFSLIKGFLGSEYGVKTIKSQESVDMINELEGNEKGFKFETTYTGKTLAAVRDFFKKEENKSKKVLFYNTYNSNSLKKFLKKTNFDFKKLPNKFHKFYDKKFQCWQITKCPVGIRVECPAFLNHEYRFWKISNMECKLDDEKRDKAREHLSNIIKLEDA